MSLKCEGLYIKRVRKSKPDAGGIRPPDEKNFDRTIDDGGRQHGALHTTYAVPNS